MLQVTLFRVFWMPSRFRWASLGGARALFWRSGETFGAVWGALGGTWGTLGDTWGALGGTWGTLGTLFGSLGGSWGVLEDFWGSFGEVLGGFGGFWVTFGEEETVSLKFQKVFAKEGRNRKAWQWLARFA